MNNEEIDDTGRTPHEQIIYWLHTLWGTLERMHLTLKEIERELKQKNKPN